MDQFERQSGEDPLGCRRELSRLYQIEYGEKSELTIRMVGTAIGSVAIWIYTGWVAVWFWVTLYFALEAAYFVFLRARIEGAQKSDVRIAQTLFVLALTSYMWIPVRMMASSDDALSVSGFCILGGVLVFLVRRSESSLIMTLLEVGVTAGAITIGVVFVMIRQTSLFAAVGLFFALTMLVFYMVQSAYLIRKQSLRADEMAERTLQAQKMEAIGRLAGGVAHDFNNILTSVIGNLDLIEEVDDPDLKREFLGNARKSALHGAEVVAQLLVYARKSDMSAQFVPADHLMANVKTLSRTLVPPRVAIDLEPLGQDRGVRVDQALFVAAMLNLIKNGTDAIEDEGKIRLYALGMPLEKELDCEGGGTIVPGDYIAFGCSDTGTGIPESILNRVTDPFFTTKTVGKGSGMGLSMVVGFAQRSGGGLVIETGNAGTTVEILLPEVPVPDPMDEGTDPPLAGMV